MDSALLAASLSAAILGANIASILLASSRLRRRGNLAVPATARAVSIVIPVRGIEAFTPETLDRAFVLDWPDYELVFCVAQADDPVSGAIRSAMKRHPDIAASLLCGDDRISANPKLNNCVKGWDAARHDWLILADSNVLMPPDYIQQMMAAWRPNTGLVCSTPIGSRPQGFWADVECAFLNTLQARWQYAGEALGMGFAQGKSMLWYKPLLEANGGIRALAAEIAEDAASTKLVNGLGLNVNLVASPFEQPLGARRFQDVWSRQARWARLRRVTFPTYFALEAFIGVALPLVLALVAADGLGISMPVTAAAVLLAAYLPEWALAASKGWYASWRLLPAMLVRDFILPAVWLRGWMSGSIDWRGNAMNIRSETSEVSSNA